MRDAQDLPAVVRSSDEMDTRNSGEVHRDTVGTLPESKQSHESCASVSNVIHLTHTPCPFFYCAYSSLMSNLHLISSSEKE